MATICCASTSSGCAGMRVSSRRPARTPRTSAAHSTSWSRVSGKSRALGTPWRVCAARPMRCRATESDRGESSWTTNSTAPMSMPSSREAVATTAFTSARFSFSSAASRIPRERLPWCAQTWSSPNRSPRAWAIRSTWRRVLTKTSVVRCSRMSCATRSHTSSRCSFEATADSSWSGTSMRTS